MCVWMWMCLFVNVCVCVSDWLLCACKQLRTVQVQWSKYRSVTFIKQLTNATWLDYPMYYIVLKPRPELAHIHEKHTRMQNFAASWLPDKGSHSPTLHKCIHLTIHRNTYV
jgi:hypothetical protein